MLFLFRPDRGGMGAWPGASTRPHITVALRRATLRGHFDGGELIPPHLQSGTVPATAVLQAVGSEEPGSHMCIYTPLAVVKNRPGRVATSPLLPSTIPYVITTSGVDGSGAQGAAPAGSAAAVRTTGAGLPVPSPHPSSGYCCTAPGSTQPRQPRAGLPLPPSPTLRDHGIRFQNVSTTLVVLTFIP